MPSRPGALMTKAIHSAAKVLAPEPTDRDLLARYSEGDEKAFATLVARYTGMVLGVCRRALPTVQDAEDACQAAFLVLARKAKDGRWESSVANWLYTTARRIAARANRTAQRRAQREARAVRPTGTSPLDQMSGREAFALLDEELDRLSPIYRAPLVLCYLQGLTRDEAAARLGIPPNTVKSQLDRGRKKLADALTRRGVVLGASLLALVATSPAGASPSRLAESVLAAVSGSPPPAVAALAEGVAVNGLFNKSLLLLLALVGAAALGIGLELLPVTAGEQPEKSPPGATPAKEAVRDAASAPEAAKKSVITGRVLNPDGEPLAGAKLLLFPYDYLGEPREAGTSGADGRFKVEVPSQPKILYLAARADGAGTDFVRVPFSDFSEEIDLRMVKDQVIRGHVVDTQGKAVAGVRVLPTKVEVYQDDSLDDFLAEWKMRLPPGPDWARRPFPAARQGVKALQRYTGVLPEVKTDADGQFTITGAGVERLVTLVLRGDGIADSQLFVVNRGGFDPKPYNRAMADKVAATPVAFPDGNRVLHGPDVSAVVEAEKRIRGRVTDLATGKPRAGIQVYLTREAQEPLRAPLGAKTDADGHYEIRGARKANVYTLNVEGDPKTRYISAQVRAVDTAGYEPVTADIGMKKGVLVKGKVINAATKMPMPGYVKVAVLSDNPFVKDYPEFDLIGPAYQLTAADGTFRVMTIPGPVLLMGGPNDRDRRYKRVVPDPKYPKYFDTRGGHPLYFAPRGAVGIVQGNFCKVLEIEAGAEVVEQDIILESDD
jgi:RNA polymerase sigma factor (sigma-70 family)